MTDNDMEDGKFNIDEVDMPPDVRKHIQFLYWQLSESGKTVDALQSERKLLLAKYEKVKNIKHDCLAWVAGTLTVTGMGLVTWGLAYGTGGLLTAIIPIVWFASGLIWGRLFYEPI